MALYLGIIGAAVVTLLVVLHVAQGLDPAPQLPALLRANRASASCLGTTVSALQSGVFLELQVPDPAALANGEGNLGHLVGQGRIDRSTGFVAVSGMCAPASELAARPFDAHLTVRPTGARGADGASLAGLLRVDGQQPVSLELRGIEIAPEKARADAPTRLSGGSFLTRVFLAIVTVCVAALLLGHLFKRLGQPRVLGEIVGGIMLGPSMLGTLRPEITSYLFSPEVVGVLRIMSEFGLILFMFIIGLGLNRAMIREKAHGAVLISHVSIAVPFALGLAIALIVYPLAGSSSFLGFALFMGVAMAITAFPVLARILTDTGLYRTPVGMLSITCAAVDDVTAWCLLAVVTAVVQSTGFSQVMSTIVLAVTFVAVMIFAVRPLAVRASSYYSSHARIRPAIVVGVLASLFAAAWATDSLGLHEIFGAFLLGAIMPRSNQMVSDLVGKLEGVTSLLLLPIFFAIVGLETRIGLTAQPALWWGLAILILATAVISKWGGSALAARVVGFKWRDANALGILLNTRGLTEIIILTLGRNLGVVSPALFSMMVLMALVTTLMATPLLHAMYSRE